MQYSNSEVLSRGLLSTSFLSLMGGGKRDNGAMIKVMCLDPAL